MNITLVHQYFYPEIAGAAVRLTELATGLKEQGFDISVITSSPHKQKTSSDEVYKEVPIHRTSKIWFDKNNPFGRVLNALYFFVSAFFNLLKIDRNSILLIGSDPPFLPLLGWILNKIGGQSYVVLVFDIYPELAIQLGYLKPNGWLARFWNRLDALALSKAKAIIVPGKYMKYNLLKKIKDESAHSKVWIIPTWEDGEQIRPIEKEKNWFSKQYGLLGKTTVLYSGNMGLAHELASLIEAAEILQSHTEIAFLFIGDGGQKKQLIQLVEKKNLRNMRFLPLQPTEITPYSCTSGDIAVISLKPEATGLCVPTKLQTALAGGQAILAIAPKESEIADILEKGSCGLRVDPGSAEKIAEAILKFHQNPELMFSCGQNARKIFDAWFTKKQAVGQYAEVFESVSLVPA